MRYRRFGRRRHSAYRRGFRHGMRRGRRRFGLRKRIGYRM